MIIKKGVIAVFLLLLSSQAFGLCDPNLSEGKIVEFKETSDLFVHCMMIQGAIMIKRGETGRDNVIGKSLPMCNVHLLDNADVLVDVSCSKSDALKHVISVQRQNLDSIYSIAQSHFQQVNKLKGR